MTEHHPYARRAHLEAVLLARVMLDPAIADYIDRRCLSPAADRLFEAAISDPDICLGSGLLCRTTPPSDADGKRFCIRLAERVEKLSLREIGFFSVLALIAFVNSLPRMRGGRAAHLTFEAAPLERRLFA